MPTLEDRYILDTLEYYCKAVSFLMPYFIGFSHIWENRHVCLAFCMLATAFQISFCREMLFHGDNHLLKNVKNPHPSTKEFVKKETHVVRREQKLQHSRQVLCVTDVTAKNSEQECGSMLHLYLPPQQARSSANTAYWAATGSHNSCIPPGVISSISGFSRSTSQSASKALTARSVCWILGRRDPQQDQGS